jgi:asparagine N-glycosylation enzyme membrane subunit Stt3
LAAGVTASDAAVCAARRRLRAAGGRAAVVAAFAALLGGRIPDLARNLAGGIGYVTKTSRGAATAGGLTSFPREMLLQIYEVRPLLADGWRLAFDTLSAAFFLVPVALAVWAVRAVGGPRRSAHLLLAGWGSLTLWLALSQRLNIYYAAPLAALAGWEVARQVSTRLSRRMRTFFPASGRTFSPAVGRTAVALLLLLTALPGLRRQIATRYAPGDDLVRTMEWARVQLPHPVSAGDPRFLPPVRPIPELARAEGMLSPWALGHFVTYYAELPAPADAFGYGFLDSIRFFLSESEEEALAIARERRSRWIAVTDLAPKMNDYGKILGRAPYLAAAAQELVPTAAYFRTMQSRLYDFDGGGPQPLTRFRLIHASRTGTLRGGRFVARWKIFEVVAP